MFTQAMLSPRHPVLAHIVPVRRCNLACVYCNEYDNHSDPVPTSEMIRRIDRLAALGTTIITFSGGEPLLHPELEALIRTIRNHGIIATLITNGYLLNATRIKSLNEAGLDQLQLSIDNVTPDDVSQKSLKTVDRKLELLAQWAKFDVDVNCVVGASLCNPGEALTVARRAWSLGFNTIVGIIHDGSGQLLPLTDDQRKVLEAIMEGREPTFLSFTRYNPFQVNLARGMPNDWRCRGGSRYLYICENGLVHWCSQQRGKPGIPLLDYTREHLDREFKSIKPCARYCTIGCVHRVALLDSFREAPRETLARLFASRREPNAPTEMPLAVKLLTWLFLPPKQDGRRKMLTQLLTRGALRLFGLRR